MRQPTRKNALMAGLFGALNLLVDMQYGVFMAFLGGCLLLTKPLRGLLVERGQAGRRWTALVGVGITAIMLTLPYFWETVKSFTSGFVITGWGDALKLSSDLLGWFSPTALHPIWGADWSQRLRAVQEGTAPFRDVNTVFLGYVTLALALIGAAAAWKRAKGWIWPRRFRPCSRWGRCCKSAGASATISTAWKRACPCPSCSCTIFHSCRATAPPTAGAWC